MRTVLYHSRKMRWIKLKHFFNKIKSEKGAALKAPPPPFQAEQKWSAAAAATTVTVAVNKDDSYDEDPYPVIVKKIAKTVVVHIKTYPF